MTRCTITYIGGPTAVLEVGEVRFLTDPTFDAPGQRYRFGFGTGSTKTQGPAIPAGAVGPIDAVLLSHDQHDDNLDGAGRALLPAARTVLTTVAGARRLAGNARGLLPWQSAVVTGTAGTEVRVTATPARHGSMGTQVVSGPTIGFLMEWVGQEVGALYLSGDTVYFPGIAEVGRRFKVGVAILHLGGVRFAVSGPARYTFDIAGAIRAADALGARHVVPLHFEGWSHFRTPRPEVEAGFADVGKAGLLTWPVPGQAVELPV